MTTTTVAIFALVYLGMILGGLPFLQLDRTGVALLGAIALVGVGAVTPADAAGAVHLPTIILLFSFMVISAQLQRSGFYAWVTRWLAALPLGPPALLGVLDAAARRGIAIDWRTHARAGVPVALATLAVAAAFLAWPAQP